MWRKGQQCLEGQREKSVAQKLPACPVMAGATGTLGSGERAGVPPHASR